MQWRQISHGKRWEFRGSAEDSWSTFQTGPQHGRSIANTDASQQGIIVNGIEVPAPGDKGPPKKGASLLRVDITAELCNGWSFAGGLPIKEC